MEHNKLNLSEVQEFLSKQYEILNVMKNLNLRTIAYRNGITKKQGVDAFSILVSLMFFTFLGKSIHGFIKYCKRSIFLLGSKDIFYRLSSRREINWRKFLLEISIKVINSFKLFNSWEENVLVIDDTTISKKGKKIEGLSWIFDHVNKKPVKGFSAVSLCWSDRSSFIPIDIALKGSKNKVNKENFFPSMDKRTIAWSRRKEIDKDKMTLASEMLLRAKNMLIDVGAVLFDSWYCCPEFVSKVYNEIGYNVISKLKISPNLTVSIKGKKISTKRLWEVVVNKLKKELKQINKEQIRVSSIICKFGDVDVKLVFCQPEKSKKLKKRIILLSTDTELSSSEIIEMYSLRWSIEVFFKDIKNNHSFGKSKCRTFEATICFITLSLVRYILVSYMQRMREDIRERGSLFEKMRYEIEELNIIAFFDKFLNQLLSLTGNMKSIFTFFIEKLMEMQEIIKTSIENLLFLRCET